MGYGVVFLFLQSWSFWQYFVKDSGCISERRGQLSGISQGCTLSPLLFIIAMSVLLHDVVGMLGTDAREEYRKGNLSDLVYADDTLLMGVSDVSLAGYLSAVYTAGRQYGMELHWGKFQLVSTSCQSYAIPAPEGNSICTQDSIEYLGAILRGNGQSHSEVNRRIALARADFRTLCKVWSHSSLTWKGKLKVFTALVESKLLYSLAAFSLGVAEQRRLNGFQNRCIRTILGIKSAYLSRISNKTVLEKACHPAATDMLRKRRLQLFGKVLRSPENHPLHTACFIPGTFVPATDRFVRRVGRPCREWVREMVADAVSLFGSMAQAKELAKQKATWNEILFKRLGC